MFKVGDRVFNYQYGWGTINEELTKFILVLFDNCKSVSIPFAKDGKETSRSERPTLSFTEYTLEGFSQERPRPLKVPIPFKVGDKVYHIKYGWGIVTEKKDDDILSRFDEYTVWNNSDNNLLSFTEYTFQGFSQERPNETND